MVDWVNFSQLSGSGDTEITVTVSANSGATRDVDILVSGISKSLIVPLTQMPSPSHSELTFRVSSGGTISWYRDSWQFHPAAADYVPTISYSKNDGPWSTPSSASTVPVVAGDVLKFRGDNDNIIMLDFTSNYAKFSVEGCIMSLIDSTNYLSVDSVCDWGLRYKFYGCTGITDASGLVMPSGNLGYRACHSMFGYCSNLLYGPELPSTTLHQEAYVAMFHACYSLVSGPTVLPATTVPRSVYSDMFTNCSAMTTAPEICATTLWDSDYNAVGGGEFMQMFDGCKSLVNPPSVLWPTALGPGTCYNMFQSCSSLTQSPFIQAQTMDEASCERMFWGCSSLSGITCLATNITASRATQDWVSGVSQTGVFKKSSSMNSWPRGRSGIPNGWTVQDI